MDLATGLGNLSLDLIGHLLLLALNGIILLVLGATWEALPWQRASEEVEQHVTNSLKVITTGLLVADMSVDRGVSGRTC